MADIWKMVAWLLQKSFPPKPVQGYINWIWQWSATVILMRCITI